MEPAKFFSQLALVTALVGGGLAALHFTVPPAQEHGKFAVACVLLFAGLCAALFFAGRSTAGSRLKSAFINLVSMSVFGKLVVSMCLLLAYRELGQPTNQWFVAIFLWVYLGFTAFEISFLTKLAKG